MTPLAQTFTINQPINGVDAIYVTSVDLYFKSKSSVFGVEVDILTTKEGNPTFYSVARKTLPSSLINVSSDGSVGTTFLFDTPAIVETNVPYAIAIVPQGGSADYSVWTAVNGENDISTGAMVAINPLNGKLFSESNDAAFTYVPNKFLKYTLRAANFTSNTGTIVYRNANSDYFLAGQFTGSFFDGERVFMSNNQLKLASLTITGSNVYSVGETVFQPNTAANAAVANASGKVYFANTTKVLLSNSVGSFVANSTIKGTNTSYLANVTAVYQNVITTSGSNVVSVPDASSNTTDFVANQVIYVTTASGTNAQMLRIASVNTTATPHTITLTDNVAFSDSSAIIGRVRGDGDLYGYFSSKTATTCTAIITLDEVTSTQTLNFANNSGSFLIGSASGSTAKVVTLYNMYYDSLTGQFSVIDEDDNPSTFSIRGTSNTAQSRAFDTNQTTVDINDTNEFIDHQRILMSRSNELANPIGMSPSNSGSPSLLVYHNIATSNNLFSPYVDDLAMNAILAHNVVKPAWHRNGYFVTLSSGNGSFSVGDTVWQSNSTVNTSAMVIGSNNTFLILANVQSSNAYGVPLFVSNSTSVLTDANTGAVANITSVATYSETTDTNIENSRYISMSTVLADGQDAEDLFTYITAYRPPNTDLKVYSRVMAAADPQAFNGINWSYMPETGTTSLVSSSVDTNDLVELTYDFPTSVQVYASSLTLSTNNSVVFPAGYSVASFPANTYVYLADKTYQTIAATVYAAGSGYTNGDTITAGGSYAYTNATFTVTTNASGNVVSMVMATPGSFYTADAKSNLATANSTGSGSGLAINISADQFQASSKFNVRQVTAVDVTNNILTLSSNLSFSSGNAAIGYIPNMESQTTAFNYDQNNGICRYVTNTDIVYDTFKTFAIKVVFTADVSSIVPRMHDVRCLALQV